MKKIIKAMAILAVAAFVLFASVNFGIGVRRGIMKAQEQKEFEASVQNIGKEYYEANVTDDQPAVVLVEARDEQTNEVVGYYLVKVGNC